MMVWRGRKSVEFGERPFERLSQPGVVSLLVGLSPLYTVGVGVLLTPVGLLLGVLALREIRASQGRIGGRAVAVAGTLICAAWIGGLTWAAGPMQETACLGECTSHLKQHAIEAKEYARTHDGRLPPADWRPALADYLTRAAPRCPSDPEPPSFAYNTALADRPLDSIADPDEVVLFFESDDGRTLAWRHDRFHGPARSAVVYVSGRVEVRQRGEEGQR